MNEIVLLVGATLL